jgi:enoyl-CoA hydratase/carnithine racemase
LLLAAYNMVSCVLVAMAMQDVTFGALAMTQEHKPPLQRTDHAGVTVLTLSDAASRNSLSEAMLAALTSAWAAIEADHSVRCVVLAAEGPVFSSGHHLKEMQAHRNDPDGGRGYVADLMARCARMMTAIPRLRTPVIAAVEGLATAAGCQLIASCDLVVAGAAARFCTPGVNLGLFCSTPGVAIARTMSPKHAMEMLLTGDVFDAPTAARFGLVNQVVPQGEAMDAALALARKIAGRSAEAIGIGKRAFYAQLPRPLDEAYALASQTMVENFLAEEAKAGIDAFLEKRDPNWTETPR